MKAISLHQPSGILVKGVMNAALARHWLLLYVPIWIWVLTRVSHVVEVGMVA